MGLVALEHAAGAVKLAAGVQLIGRSKECFISVDDPVVSRIHLRLELTGDQLFVEDAGSTNGTYLNGERLIERTALEDGDQLTLGNSAFLVRIRSVPGFDEGDKTPLLPLLDQLGSPAELHEQCPSCNEPMPTGGSSCAMCGFERSRARSADHTEENGEEWSHGRTLKVERRSQPRHRVEIPCAFSSAAFSCAGVARDLSRNGVFVAATQVDAVGARCRVTFSPVGGEEMSIDGFVRYAIRRGVAGMGIEFGKLDDKQVRWLARQLLRARQ